MSAGIGPMADPGTAERRPLAPVGREQAGAPDWGWVVQAVTGAAVLVLVAVHMIAQHFILPEGLRDYAAVVAWLANPIVVVLEVAFLGSVTWHALQGIRAVLLDLGPSRRVERFISRALAAIGVVTVLYGLWLTGVVTGAW